MNLGWWLERTFWEHPDNVAVVDADGTATTYRELRSLADRIGNVLADHGVRPGEIVVTALPDDHVHVATLFGVWRIGAALSGLNVRLQLPKLAADVARCSARVAIAAADRPDVVAMLAAHPSIETVLTVGDRTDHPDLVALAAEAAEGLRIEPRAADDLAAVNFTSGTSGVSKGVRFTHGTLGTSAWGAIFLGGMDSRTRNLSLVGMHHSGGIHDAIRLAMVGGTILWTGGWDVDRVVRIIREHHPNFAYWIIPTMARDLMRHPSWPELDLRGLRTYVAGEPVPDDVRDALLAKGAQVGNMYGLTEAMPVCVLGPSLYYGEETGVPSGSSGRPNRSFCEVVLTDPGTGAVLEGGDVEGEVCIRGDVVTPGYLDDPERTAQTIDADGWLHTRDRAHRDADGWYRIRGRTDDVINPGGEKLSLLEVDEALLRHPDVADAGCVGVPHERFGEVPAAFVVLGPGAAGGAAARDALDAHCLAVLERWKRPRLYVLVAEVPRTAKRSKATGAMRERIAGVVLRDADGIALLDTGVPAR